MLTDKSYAMNVPLKEELNKMTNQEVIQKFLKNDWGKYMGLLGNLERRG